MPGALELSLKKKVGELLRHAVDKVRQQPHRDITSGPYKDWLQFYVKSLQELSVLSPPSAEQSALLNASQYVSQFRNELNALLLSSVFAIKWTEVYLPSWESFHSEGTPDLQQPPRGEVWWRHPRMRTSASLPASHSPEYCSPEFLTEPLLGGRTLSQYLDNMKQHQIRRHHGGIARPPVVSWSSSSRLLVPFTTLWALKCDAFGHTSSVSSSAPRLSFQERQLRRTLLHSMDYALQLTLSVTPDEELEIPPFHVLTPTEEFDSICQLSFLRSQMKQVSESERFFKMKDVVNDTLPRLAFLLYAGSFLARTTTTSQLGTTAPVLLAPVHAHKLYRDAHVLNVREQSCSVSPGKCGATHKDTVEGCKAVTRRLIKREENIRQALSLK